MSDKPVAKVMAAIPSYTGHVEFEFVESFVATWAFAAVSGVEITMQMAPGFSLVQYARNWLTQQFLESDCTHILWIDADLGWEPQALLRMLARKVDVIGGVYPIKTVGEIYPYMPAGEPENGVQMVEGLPTGFMLVSRRAMEAVATSVKWHDMTHMGKKISCPNVFDLVHEGKNFWGEDFVFCKRLRNLGFSLWAELDIDFKHVGRKVWHGNLAKRIARGASPSQDTPANDDQPPPSLEEAQKVLEQAFRVGSAA